MILLMLSRVKDTSMILVVMFQIFVPLCLLPVMITAEKTTPSSSISFGYEPSDVYLGLTEQLSMRCNYTNPQNPKISELSRLRILRQAPGEKKFEVVSDIRDNSQQPEVNKDDMFASGIIEEDVDGSYLEIYWPEANQDSIGQFKCGVFGFDDDVDLISGESDILEVNETQLTLSVLREFFSDFKKKANGEIEELTLQNADVKRLRPSVIMLNYTLNNRIDSIVKKLDARIGGIEAKLSEGESDKSGKDENVTNDVVTKVGAMESKFSELESRLKVVEDGFQRMQHKVNGMVNLMRREEWPEGSYALLKPESGCPITDVFIDGEEGALDIHTESSSIIGLRGNKVSHASHLSQPISSTVDEQNMLYLRFCGANAQAGFRSWPRGSYCINYGGNQCPPGFAASSINMDYEDSGTPLGKARGSFVEHEYLKFCCRTEGSSNIAIDLPTEYPFYLYRKGGQCQMVNGMTVKSEFVEIDTEDDGNNDQFTGTVKPDVDMGYSQIRIELCYYEMEIMLLGK